MLPTRPRVKNGQSLAAPNAPKAGRGSTAGLEATEYVGQHFWGCAVGTKEQAVGVKHLTAADVAERLSIPVWSIYQLVKDGGLPCLRVGRRLRFRLSDLELWETEKVRGSEAE